MIYLVILLLVWYLSAFSLLFYAHRSGEHIDLVWIEMAFLLGPLAWIYILWLATLDFFRKKPENDDNL